MYVDIVVLGMIAFMFIAIWFASEKPIARETWSDDDIVPVIRPRPSWPETWMNVAREISRRSYDERLKVGAIIVTEDNTQMLSVGYNGNYKGGPNKAESLEPGKSGLIHAEINALIKCDFHSPKRKHMYVTASPCVACAKLIINADVVRVVYDKLYRDPAGIDLLKSTKIEVFSLEEAIANLK